MGIQIDIPPGDTLSRPPLFPQDADESLFTLPELQKAISKLKKRKAPGPDGIPNEAFMLLDAQGELLLLDMYNETLTKCNVPSTWTEARVVNIFTQMLPTTDLYPC